MSDTKKNIIREMLSSDSKISSKRVITCGAFVLLSTCTISELFFNFSVSENVFENIMYLVSGGLLFTASEKFAKKKNENVS
tara:strand:+ start:3064 stop:3306 length:243 start_codon:yes stop_codon:yes gene_type:complete